MTPYRFKDLFRDAMDFVEVGILFLGVSVLGMGLVLGPALQGLFAVSFRILDRRKAVRVWKDFWTGFRGAFWSGEIVGLVGLFAGLGIWFVLRYGLENGLPWLFASGVATGLLGALFLLVFFPMNAVFQAASPGQMLKNAFLLAARHPFRSLLLLGAAAVPFLLFELWSGTVLVSPALFAALAGAHLRRLFLPYLDTFIPADPAGD